ncbi:MAG: Flp pilus assembly protein CpaB [Alphaproteobacteria bacterium]|nr:Flp pilus assembly protein CpaB [Alphaproteobacteria bacterium]
MNKNILIVLGGAILAAVLVAMLVQVSMGGKKTVVKSGEMVEILVADDDFKVGHELVAGDLRWQEWPKEAVFKGAITRDGDEEADGVLEGRLRRDLTKDEAVTKSILLKETKGNFVAASLKPGMRAMAIKVDPESMVAGFISPGDYVDVVLTYKKSIRLKDKNPKFQQMVDQNIDKMAAETILENVRVVAIDQSAEREDDDKISVGKTVTLAVNIQQAERLALGSELGALTLALRGVGDDAEQVDTWPTVTDARMTSIGDEVFMEYEKMKEDSGVKKSVVRLYSGAHMQEVPVQ